VGKPHTTTPLHIAVRAALNITKGSAAPSL
jgi:hypothetical protein